MRGVEKKPKEGIFQKGFFVELLSSVAVSGFSHGAARRSFRALNQRKAPSVLIPGQSQTGSPQGREAEAKGGNGG